MEVTYVNAEQRLKHWRVCPVFVLFFGGGGARIFLLTKGGGGSKDSYRTTALAKLEKAVVFLSDNCKSLLFYHINQESPSPKHPCGLGLSLFVFPIECDYYHLCWVHEQTLYDKPH